MFKLLCFKKYKVWWFDSSVLHCKKDSNLKKELKYKKGRKRWNSLVWKEYGNKYRLPRKEIKSVEISR